MTGDAGCATTAIAIEGFDARPDPAGAGIELTWRIADPAGARVALDRAVAGGLRLAVTTSSRSVKPKLCCEATRIVLAGRHCKAVTVFNIAFFMRGKS